MATVGCFTKATTNDNTEVQAWTVRMADGKEQREYSKREREKLLRWEYYLGIPPVR